MGVCWLLIKTKLGQGKRFGRTSHRGAGIHVLPKFEGGVGVPEEAHPHSRSCVTIDQQSVNKLPQRDKHKTHLHP